MTTTTPRDGAEIRKALSALAQERILLLDGAMGTMIQDRKFSEEDFRGERFKDWKRDLRADEPGHRLVQELNVGPEHVG